MRLSTRILLVAGGIILIVLLIGIFTTLATFTKIFAWLEFWLTIWLIICCYVALVVGALYALVAIQVKRQKLIRYAPSPEGYYEALRLPDNTFIKPEDNIPLVLQCHLAKSTYCKMASQAQLSTKAYIPVTSL